MNSLGDLLLAHAKASKQADNANDEDGGQNVSDSNRDFNDNTNENAAKFSGSNSTDANDRSVIAKIENKEKTSQDEVTDSNLSPPTTSITIANSNRMPQRNFPERIVRNDLKFKVGHGHDQDLDAQSNASSTDDYVAELLDPNDRPRNVWRMVAGPDPGDSSQGGENRSVDESSNLNEFSKDYSPSNDNHNNDSNNPKIQEPARDNNALNVDDLSTRNRVDSRQDLDEDSSDKHRDRRHHHHRRHHNDEDVNINDGKGSADRHRSHRHGSRERSSSSSSRRHRRGESRDNSTRDRRGKSSRDDKDRRGHRSSSHRSSNRRRDGHYSGDEDDVDDGGVAGNKYQDRDYDSRSRRRHDYRDSRRSRSPRSSHRDHRYRDDRSRSSNRSRSPMTKRNSRTILIMQLNPRVSQRDLEDFFSTVGHVKEVRLIMDSKTRRHKGIAYIEFEDTSSASKAFAMNGQEFMGAPMVIQSADKSRSDHLWPAATSSDRSSSHRHYGNGSNSTYRDPHQHHQQHPSGGGGGSRGSNLPPNSYRIYVGALHLGITDEMLRSVFEPFGPIIRLELIKDRVTNASKGYAFITYANIDDGQLAVQSLDGLELGGKAIRVSKSTDKSERTGGGGSGHQATDSSGRLSRDVTTNLFELAGH